MWCADPGRACAVWTPSRPRRIVVDRNAADLSWRLALRETGARPRSSRQKPYSMYGTIDGTAAGSRSVVLLPTASGDRATAWAYPDGAQHARGHLMTSVACAGGSRIRGKQCRRLLAVLFFSLPKCYGDEADHTAIVTSGEGTQDGVVCSHIPEIPPSILVSILPLLPPTSSSARSAKPKHGIRRRTSDQGLLWLARQSYYNIFRNITLDAYDRMQWDAVARAAPTPDTPKRVPDRGTRS